MQYPPLKVVDEAEAEAPLLWCGQCAVEHPASACRDVVLAGEGVKLCPGCGLVVRPLVHVQREPLGTVFLGAFRYPLNQDGAVALVALAVGCWALRLVPVLGGVLAMGVSLGYLFVVVRHTGRGRDTLPAPTEFEGLSDILAPAVRFVLAGLMALVPLLYVLSRANLSAPGASVSVPGLVIAGLWAVAWMPAAMAVAAHQEGCLGSLNPVPVVQVIARIPGDYARTVLVLAPLVVLSVGVDVVAAMLLRGVRVPVVTSVVAIAFTAVGLYLPMVMSRILGLLLRERAAELGLGP